MAVVQLEGAIERRAQLEAQFRPHQVDGVAAERPARGQQETAGMLGQMHHAMRFVDQDAGRRDLLDGAAMHRRLAQRDRRAHRARQRNDRLADAHRPSSRGNSRGLSPGAAVD